MALETSAEADGSIFSLFVGLGNVDLLAKGFRLVVASASDWSLASRSFFTRFTHKFMYTWRLGLFT